MNPARIIPTCVGKSRLPARPSATTPDHPHVRGEKVLVTVRTFHDDGSSPRAWGKGKTLTTVREIPRIIPTCVGKSFRCRRKRGLESDHPHVRGEKAIVAASRYLSGGSSPRAWGKGLDVAPVVIDDRIIPTCVGKRVVFDSAGRLLSDHPHVRGEKNVRL